jgi:hypothetical protein
VVKSAAVAVERELKSLGAVASESWLAPVVLALAAEMDKPAETAAAVQAKAACARELRELMERLAVLAVERRGDALDELGSRRQARRAAAR